MTLQHKIENWRFLYLLIALLFALVFEPILLGLAASAWAFDAFFSFVLVAAVYALAVKQRHKWIIVAIGALVLLGTWSAHVLPGDAHRVIVVVQHVLGIVFLAYVTCSTVNHVIRAENVTHDSIFASAAGYLLLGTIWGMIYSLLHLHSPDAFSMGEDLPRFLDEGAARLPIFIYYSFVTLTTLGFGDITPVTPTARTLSWLEAVSGQFYIAIIVAGIIGVVVTRGTRHSTRPGPDKTHDDANPTAERS